MKHSNFLLYLIIPLFFSCNMDTIQQKEIGIIPEPLFQELDKGVFIMDEKVLLVSEPKLNEVSDYFKTYFEENYQIEFDAQKGTKKIIFTINNAIPNEEGYELKIEEENIFIESKNARGAFYAVQSLIQLVPLPSDLNSYKVPCLRIKDQPQFTYRGMHLDVGRHFFSVEFIKKYIDLIYDYEGKD